MLSKIANIYHEKLFSSKQALDYLKNRKVSEDTINKFHLGYCDQYGAYDILKHQYSDEILLKTGFFIKNRNNIRDFFSKRITIPLFENHQIKYMTGRAINNSLKYLHQKGKRQNVFNEDILKTQKNIVIVEGPFDCFSLDYWGIPSIALLGINNIPSGVVRKLYNKNVYIAFDNDANSIDNPGKKAAIKLAKKLAFYKIKSKIITLPSNSKKVDINSYMMEHNGSDFYDLIKKSILYDKPPRKQRFYKKIMGKKNIVEVASHYVEIEKAGSLYRSVCPFHKDNDPSLVYYETTNTFYCFGCGATGGTLDFIKKIEFLKGNNITYKAAKNIEDSL